MDTRVPELDQQLSAQQATASDAGAMHDEESSQQAALAELADRINAARSII
jgi:hypothetical protein